MRVLSLLVLSLALVACSDDSGSDSIDAGSEDLVLNDPAPPASDDPALVGKTITDYFGQDGNLWKPAGDDHGAGPGNLVILAGAKYSTQFESCSLKKTDGTTAPLTCINNAPWTHIPYSCFGNPLGGGDRQHWRADFRCGSAAAVEVICSLGLDTYVFIAPDGRLGEVCTRFG